MMAMVILPACGIFSFKIRSGTLFFYTWLKEKPGAGFFNLSIFQKWLVKQTICPIVAAGQNFEVFAKKKLALYWKTFK